MTGLYPHQAGMGHLDNDVRPGSRGYQGRLTDECVTIAEVLKPAGYFTAMTGKWHLGQQHGTPPWERGFERSLNSQAGGIYFPASAEERTPSSTSTDAGCRSTRPNSARTGTAPIFGPMRTAVHRRSPGGEEAVLPLPGAQRAAFSA